MELILYITGGIALLALAWLLILIAKTIGKVEPVVTELLIDLRTIVVTVDELKVKMTPVLDDMAHISLNVKGITSNVNNITTGLQNQMIGVHETIDDALDIVRGTLDDIERLKDDVVATVAGPVKMARSATNGAIGTGIKVFNILYKLFDSRKKKSSMNGYEKREN
jgi:uncharacterized protein YoxC